MWGVMGDGMGRVGRSGESGYRLKGRRLKREGDLGGSLQPRS